MLEVSGAEVTTAPTTSTSVPTVARGRAVARSSASVEAALVQVAVATRALQRTATKTAAGPISEPATLINGYFLGSDATCRSLSQKT